MPLLTIQHTMNIKELLFLLQLLTFTLAASNFRYNNRVLKTPRTYYKYNDAKPISEEFKQKKDCIFNICENVSYYPEDDVRRIVDQHGSFHSFLKGRVIEPVKSISLVSRDGENMQSFCKTVDVVAAPKLMMDIENVRRRIVNLQNYSQILKYQTCNLDDSEDCFKETLLDVKTKCVQKFNNIKLVTVDVDVGMLEYRTFTIPTTCVCTYIRGFF